MNSVMENVYTYTHTHIYRGISKHLDFTCLHLHSVYICIHLQFHVEIPMDRIRCLIILSKPVIWQIKWWNQAYIDYSKIIKTLIFQYMHMSNNISINIYLIYLTHVTCLLDKYPLNRWILYKIFQWPYYFATSKRAKQTQKSHSK